MSRPERSPAVSVVVPTRDRAHLLGRAVASVLAQSFEDFELIVVDDGSTDDTPGRIRGLEDPRVRYLQQDPIGAGAARNRGATAARGEYLTFLDSDDEAEPMWLEKLLETLEATGAPIAFCGLRYVEEDGREDVRPPVPWGPIFENWTASFKAGTFVLRRDLFEAVGGYRQELPANQHTELGIRIVDHCAERGWESAVLRDPLIIAHRHAGPRIRKDPEAVLEATEKMLEWHRERLQRHPQDYVDYLVIAGTAAVRLGRGALARSYYAEAVRRAPRGWKNYLRWLLTLLGPLDYRRWR